MTENYDIAFASLGLIVKPFRTLQEVYFRYQERIFYIGIILSLIGQVSFAVADALFSGGQLIGSFSFFISYVFYRVFMNYFLLFIFIALVFFIINRTRPEVKAEQLAGLVLFPDFLYCFILPAALLIKTIPSVSAPIYSIISFSATVLIYILKLKAISIAARLSLSKSFGLMLVPLGLILVFIAANAVYFVGLISSYLG
ncbi:MAG: hypothetical protein HPY53_01740 [Brevinematales bacterium]|nr:hypothetical protein [Brevinematales bacterium]